MAGTSIQRTRDELGNQPDTSSVRKIFSAPTNTREGSTIREERDVSSDTIWGNSTWNGGEWDSTYTNSKIRTRVDNYNDTWIEEVQNTDFYDLTNSTGITWNTTTNIITFAASGVLRTFAVFLDSSNTKSISSAILTVVVDTGSVTLEMSANGGTNWDPVTSGVANVFTNTGSELLVRVTESTTVSTATISNMRVSYS